MLFQFQFGSIDRIIVMTKIQNPFMFQFQFGSIDS